MEPTQPTDNQQAASTPPPATTPPQQPATPPSSEGDGEVVVSSLKSTISALRKENAASRVKMNELEGKLAEFTVSLSTEKRRADEALGKLRITGMHQEIDKHLMGAGVRKAEALSRLRGVVLSDEGFGKLKWDEAGKLLDGDLGLVVKSVVDDLGIKGIADNSAQQLIRSGPTPTPPPPVSAQNEALNAFLCAINKG